MELLTSFYFYCTLISGIISFYSFKKASLNNLFAFLSIISTICLIIFPIYLYQDLTNGYSKVNYETNIYKTTNFSFFFKK